MHREQREKEACLRYERRITLIFGMVVELASIRVIRVKLLLLPETKLPDGARGRRRLKKKPVDHTEKDKCWKLGHYHAKLASEERVMCPQRLPPRHAANVNGSVRNSYMLRLTEPRAGDRAHVPPSRVVFIV